jgi:hypothetical protein
MWVLADIIDQLPLELRAQAEHHEDEAWGLIEQATQTLQQANALLLGRSVRIAMYESVPIGKNPFPMVCWVEDPAVLEGVRLEDLSNA